jgi:hypothetical protein
MYYVALPNGHTWCPWKRAFDSARIQGVRLVSEGYYGEGWEIVCGDPAKLSIQPSINSPSGTRADGAKGYHGYLTNGILSDPT